MVVGSTLAAVFALGLVVGLCCTPSSALTLALAGAFLAATIVATWSSAHLLIERKAHNQQMQRLVQSFADLGRENRALGKRDRDFHAQPIGTVH